MKYQKSSMPYLLLLFVILIVLPILDHRVENSLSLEVNIHSSQAVIDNQSATLNNMEKFVTVSEIRPPQ